MRKRILAVDDEIRVLTMIKKRLEFAGYDVIMAVEGLEGLKKARSENPDLIVLDLILPNLNGYQICAMLKGDRVLKNIPILMLTARSQEKDVKEGMKVGADAYMTKPYDPEMFVTQVESLLRRADEDRAGRQAEATTKEQKELEDSTSRAEKFSRLLGKGR